MCETNAIKGPLDERYRVFIPATVALDKMDDQVAREDLQSLRASKDERIRAKTLKNWVNCRKLEPPPLGPVPSECRVTDEMLEAVRAALQDTHLQVRKQALQTTLILRDPRWFSDLAPHLLDASEPLRDVAVSALLACASSQDADLEAIFPWLEKADTEEESHYDTRIRALHSLRFLHSSRIVQDRLLAIFDRPELGVKRELMGAFRFCPDQTGLEASILERFKSSEPAQAISALFVLSIFRNPEFRPHFHTALGAEHSTAVLAGLVGIYPLLSSEDLPALLACRARWRP